MKRASSTTPARLTDIIQALKRQLVEAAKQNNEKMFKVAEATIEVGVNFTRSSKAGLAVGISFDVTDAASSQHKMVIRLVPLSESEIKVLTVREIESGRIQGTNLR